jgi:hypothetical protein
MTTTEARHDQDFSSRLCEWLDGLERDGLLSKTYPDYSAVSRGLTLPLWLGHWLDASSAFPTKGGEKSALLPALTGWSSGACWMRNGLEFRNGAAVCSLSEILETGTVDPQFFLSATACRGILRRAEKRGKALPEQLRLALEQVATGRAVTDLPEAM